MPDVLLWYSTNNYYTNGPLAVGKAKGNLGIWDPYASVVGDTTFLVENSTYADDGLQVNKRYALAIQPVAGGAPKLGEVFYADDGTPFRGQIDYNRQSGNPGRVAGDKRLGAANFIAGGEASPGVVLNFQSDYRWTSNAIYANNWRYGCVQTYSMNPTTLLQTPLCKAFDAINGRQTGAFNGNAGEVTRFGGELAALDDGNFVVMVDDRSLYSGLARTATYVIIRPDGSIVKDTAPVDDTLDGVQIWSNLAAYRGGFCIRYNHTLYFFNNAGVLQGTVDQDTSGISFDMGRGDQTRIASDIRSHYVYLAGAAPYSGQPTHAPVMLAIWDADTRQFVTSATVSDTDPAVHGIDAVNLAVDALDRVCVAYDFRPTPAFSQYQTAARVMKFDGTNITYLTRSFFPFVNHDENGSLTSAGFTTQTPGVAMTTKYICISGKGTVNGTNNPAGGPDTPGNTAFYTVISHPAPVELRPTMTATRSGNNLTIAWNAETGVFTLQSTSVLPSGWLPVTPQPAIVQDGPNYKMTVQISAGNAYFRLVR